MLDPHTLNDRIGALEFVRGGLVPVDVVLDSIIEPLRQMLLDTSTWLTLTELIDETSHERNYFVRRGADGQSRLERWEGVGLARQASRGPWLISERVLPECGVSATREDQPTCDDDFADRVLTELEDDG